MSARVPRVHLVCPACGAEFERHRCEVRRIANRGGTPVCSRACHLKRHNNPDRNRAVAVASREKQAATQRDRGEGKTYRKYLGRHEHRVVMERTLGRPLKPGEVVHHIDGDKRNNDPDNLRVFASQAEHARHHADLRKATA